MALGVISGKGFIIGDIDFKFVGERAVANFPVAFNKDKKNESTGQWEKDKSAVIRCAAWGPLAEFVQANFTAKTEIELSGEFYIRPYEKDGETRQSAEMTVRTVSGPIPKRKGSGDDGGWGNA
jgi:single-strand DNA-binding protein